MNVTYKGRIPNTPLCIDDFRPSLIQDFLDTPLASTCQLLFFLSHLHKDHTSGLSPSWQHGRIITTHVNRALLLSLYSLPHNLITALHYNTPTTLPLTSSATQPQPTTHVTVTLLPVYHCPGACMVVLDGYWGRVVYTGDMRWLPGTGLGGEGGTLLSRPVDVLYLDNTYANERYDRFLSREEVVRAVVDVVEAHGGGEACDVLINSDLLGKEDVLVMVARRCRCLIAVEEAKYAMLRALHDAHYDLNECYTVSTADERDQSEPKEAMSDARSVAEEERLDAEALSYPSWFYYFTTNRAETFLHVAPKRLLNKKHVEALNEANSRAGRRSVLAILMQGWAVDSQQHHIHSTTHTAADTDVADGPDPATPTRTDSKRHALQPLSPSRYCSGDATHRCGIHQLPYSSHSSYSELQAFLSHVRPRSILPISSPLSQAALYTAHLDSTPPTSFTVPSELVRASLKDAEWMLRASRAAGHLQVVRRRRSDGWLGGKRRRAFAFDGYDEQLDESPTAREQEQLEDDVLMEERKEQKCASAVLDLTTDSQSSSSLPSPYIEILNSSLSSDDVQILSPPAAAASSFRSLDDPVRHFSLRINPDRCHLISRLSLTNFQIIDVPASSPSDSCSPHSRAASNPSTASITLAAHTASLPVRRLPAFLTQSTAGRRGEAHRSVRTPYVAAAAPEPILHPTHMRHPWSRVSSHQLAAASSPSRHKLQLHVAPVVAFELERESLRNVTSAVNNSQCLNEQRSDASLFINAASCSVALTDALDMPPLEPA